MLGTIRILPETLTHRIAAGEVVERPASIVKELMENALDAGATEIVVALERGGCESIRVTDNGEGITPEEVPLAFSRYATSKIGDFEDIYAVQTFGFRGEALPSIASIAHVEMVTRRVASPAGTRIVVEGGEVTELAEVGCPVGTSLLVNGIFAPVPVRRKFLKNDATEQGACIDAITRLTLARPEVTIRVAAGGRSVLNIPAVKDLAERIALTLGRDFRGHLVPAAGERDGVRLRGFVSRPEFTRSSASQLYLYVNGRFVKDTLLNHAVMTAYRRIIAPRRYPAAVLILELPSGDVDVNVHPAKLEVRFRNPREVYALVVETLNGAIGAEPISTGASGEAGMQARGSAPYAARVEEALKRYHVSSGSEKLFFPIPASVKRDAPPATPDPVAGASSAAPVSELPRAPEGEATPAEEPRCFASLRYMGQAVGTYLLFTDEEGLVLVDQHAAHERVLFERLRRQADGEKLVGQRLLLPEVISLPPRDFAFLTESLPILEGAGMEVEPFGGDSLVVKAVPSFLSHAEARQLILDLLADCSEADRRLPLTDRRERIFTALACRGAIKANRELTVAEVAALCGELDAIAHAATCPHGRPVCVSFSVFDLEKLFKRR